MATHGNMETFDLERGDDWPMYTEWIEQYFATNAIESEAKKRAVLLTCTYWSQGLWVTMESSGTDEVVGYQVYNAD